MDNQTYYHFYGCPGFTCYSCGKLNSISYNPQIEKEKEVKCDYCEEINVLIPCNICLDKNNGL